MINDKSHQASAHTCRIVSTFGTHFSTACIALLLLEGFASPAFYTSLYAKDKKQLRHFLMRHSN